MRNEPFENIDERTVFPSKNNTFSLDQKVSIFYHLLFTKPPPFEMGHFALWLMAALMTASTQMCAGYKPVFMVHGLGDNSSAFDHMAQRIQKAHPGTVTFSTNAYPGVLSNTPLWVQIKGDLGKEFQEFSKKYPQGFHLMGSSQGGLLGRALIETYPDHNVKTFITMASPLSGVYMDIPDFPEANITVPKSVAHFVLYNPPMQSYVSAANIYKDPTHQDLYLKYNNFMPYIDNEIRSNMSESYKKGFTKVSKIVLIGGPDDGFIHPWESSIFSDIGADGKAIDFRQRKAYKEDSFGLRTMDEQKKITIYIRSNVEHSNFKKNDTVIDECILPHLD